MGDVRDGGDLLEAVLHDLRQGRDVLVELVGRGLFIVEVPRVR